MKQYVLRSTIPGDDGSVPDSCLNNVVRLAGGLPPGTRVRY